MTPDGKLKVHIVGTHGVPAKYGGFETLADFLCQYLSDDFDITVYCNAKIYPTKEKEYHGVKLRYLKLNASGVKGIIYDIITYIPALFKADVILFLGPVGSGFITPIRKLFKTKVIVNHGGLNEWEREKLSWFQKKWAKFNHRIAARHSNINVVDNVLYQASLKLNFNTDSVVIRYGGDHVKKVSLDKYVSKYPFAQERYAISVSRAQLDNNLHLALEAFKNSTNLKLVLVSNWNVSSYGKKLKEQFANESNLILLDAVYVKEELNYLRSNSYLYVHTHSRCGTAPSLVEAMHLEKAILSFDVGTNRETTDNKAFYFNSAEELEELVHSLSDEQVKNNATLMKDIADRNYSWQHISDQYKEIIR